MFMFHSKRTRLIKQLLRGRKRRPPSSCCSTDDSSPTWLSGSEVADETMVQQLHTIMEKRLKICQLEMLWTTVRTAGKQHSGCVLMSRDGDPHVLFCQFYRAWKGVECAEELRRLPTCRTAADPVYICVNPYHWTRLLQPDTPPPPYSTCALSRLKPEDRAPSEAPIVFRDAFVGSLTTSGEDRAPSEAPIVFRDAFVGSLTTSGEADTRNLHEWCKLAYWELARRVGPLFPVDTNCVNVFGDACGPATTLDSGGLCLHTLAQTWSIASVAAAPDGCADYGHHHHHHHLRYPNNGCCGSGCGIDAGGQGSSDAVAKTRSKIGLGVTVSREDSRIWLYNRSDYPVFVNSLRLDECNPHSTSILSNAYPIRLQSGHCMCIYDHLNHQHHPHTTTTNNNNNNVFGPVDRNSVRVSFVKGWGAHKYSRREITSCPCWLEILLAPCR